MALGVFPEDRFLLLTRIQEANCHSPLGRGFYITSLYIYRLPFMGLSTTVYMSEAATDLLCGVNATGRNENTFQINPLMHLTSRILHVILRAKSISVSSGVSPIHIGFSLRRKFLYGHQTEFRPSGAIHNVSLLIGFK